MNSFEDVDDGEPPVINPYEVLGIERTATADEVKSAYRKAALKHHPDKVGKDKKADAHEKFQSIAFAYAVLSDPKRRKRYDATGSTAETIAADEDGFSWSDFYRAQFEDAVSADAIEEFSKRYKGSDEERDDLLAAYEEHEGNMDGVYESVMLSNVLEDDERFRRIIDEAIAGGDAEAYPAYTRESKKKQQARVKAAQRESHEAEEYAKELGVHDKLFGDGGKGAKGGKGKKAGASSEDALAALIKSRQQNRGSGFLDRLAEKYGATNAKAKKKGKKRVIEEDEEAEEAEDEAEPSEEAFQAAAARLKKQKPKAAKSDAAPAPATNLRRSKRAKR